MPCFPNLWRLRGFGGDETHGLTAAGDALPCHGIVDGEADD